MENSEPSASKSDLGLGIIDTACLFCVAGSDWWANYKSLLEDFGLKHEIDETREAERYKIGDGGTLVSSIRVTAPIFCCWQEGQNCFQRGSFETPFCCCLELWSRLSVSPCFARVCVRAGQVPLGSTRTECRKWILCASVAMLTGQRLASFKKILKSLECRHGAAFMATLKTPTDPPCLQVG